MTEEQVEKALEEVEVEQTEEVTEAIESEGLEEKKEDTDKSSEYLERLQRLMAEFDNYRKRSEKEREGLYDLGVSSTITELLPIVDNFERALEQECADEQYAEGVKMIYKQLLGLFEKLDVTSIEAVGKTFDPSLHNAIMQIQDESFGENEVAQEHQKGYMYKEKVIRYSMVTVAN